MVDLAQEVGYLKGMQEATQRELANLSNEMKHVKDDVSDVKKDVAEVKTTVDEILTTMRGSGTQTAQNQGVVATILKSPITPTLIAVLGMLVVLTVVLSAQTGRSASTFVPYPAAALPPGGSATSTTTVTAPSAKE
jgi:hypothetical protein